MKRLPSAAPLPPLPALPTAGEWEGDGPQGVLLRVPTVRALAQAELTLPPDEEPEAERPLGLAPSGARPAPDCSPV